MHCKRLASLALTLWAVAGSSAASGQDSTPKAKDSLKVQTSALSRPRAMRIAYVYDSISKEPITDALVTDLMTKNTVKSHSKVAEEGYFALPYPEFVSEKGGLIVVSKLGYESFGPVLVDPTDTALLRIAMLRTSQKLAAVVTTERFNIATDAGTWAGFDARCGTRSVTCIKADEIAAHPSASIVYFLNKAGGVVGDCASAFTRGSRSRRTTSSGAKIPDCIKMHGAGLKAGALCIPTFYVDGTMRGYSESALNDIEEYLNAPSVKGIEVYLSDQGVPLRIGPATGNEGCGSVAIWTR